MNHSTLRERLFPCIYKTRAGGLVEILDFAYIGVILNEDNTKRELHHIWTLDGNLLIPVGLNTPDSSKFDLMELVKSPQIAGILKKSIGT